MRDIVFRTALVLLAVAVPAWIVLSLGIVLGRVSYDDARVTAHPDRPPSARRGD